MLFPAPGAGERYLEHRVCQQGRFEARLRYDQRMDATLRRYSRKMPTTSTPAVGKNSRDRCRAANSHCLLEDAECLALSYIWGGVQQRSVSGSSSLHDQLGATIEHAIRAAQALGHRYIWVDSICIDQSNA
ncbi:hypothetical protein BCR34DRAFT_552312 [Clohesyomyces aquaticus]|uniref:Heterokaryon incompatibility domain-containing protein n=1 Tax=Clohesyomyces aquaticus TaxID=1231657 RepID=A0A1Y2AAJ5_9PLEO|nr:hypothetical protein BCR34DRAFT_552312 [Clohesyomyces aquaticus]